MKRVLVTGAAGQIGSELAEALRDRYGSARVLATDIRPPDEWNQEGPSAALDCLDPDAVLDALRSFRPDVVYHLAAILSAAGEANPALAYRVNMDGLVHVLEAARLLGCQLFVPSSIAAFGPQRAGPPAPQTTVQRPTTMYGVTKVAGELLCDYYHRRYDLDVRGLRFPGLVSYRTRPGGGTTDYAVEAFHAAVNNETFECFLRPSTRLDMMYMPDALRAMVELMEAPGTGLQHRNAFNVTAMQFTPAELEREIRLRIPSFRMEYRPDPVRQAIADSWPRRLDDSESRRQWGWRHQYDLGGLVDGMLRGLGWSATEPAVGASVN